MPPGALTVPNQPPGKEITEEARFFKGLIFAHPGAGKTRLCLSFCLEPRTSPVYYLDATGGTTGILTQARAAGAKIYPSGDTDDVRKHLEYLIANGGAGYKMLVVDDFSECFSLTKEKVAKSFGHAGAEELEPTEHPKLYERTLKIYRLLKRVATSVDVGGAGMHVLITCWAEKKPNIEKAEWWVPRFAGQFGYQTPAYFDVVAYLEAKIEEDKKTKETTFTNRLITQSNHHLVRDRFALLPGIMEMPTAKAIMDAIA